MASHCRPIAALADATREALRSHVAGVGDVAGALREVVENSLDAGAACITVRLLQADGFEVEDDGHGISAAGIALVGTRYASSKGCRATGSLGFRGEALASISQVARLRVVSRAAGSFETAEAVVGPGGAPRGPCAPHELQHALGASSTRVTVTGFAQPQGAAAGAQGRAAAAPQHAQRAQQHHDSGQASSALLPGARCVGSLLAAGCARAASKGTSMPVCARASTHATLFKRVRAPPRSAAADRASALCVDIVLRTTLPYTNVAVRVHGPSGQVLLSMPKVGTVRVHTMRHSAQWRVQWPRLASLKRPKPPAPRTWPQFGAADQCWH